MFMQGNFYVLFKYVNGVFVNGWVFLFNKMCQIKVCGCVGVVNFMEQFKIYGVYVLSSIEEIGEYWFGSLVRIECFSFLWVQFVDNFLIFEFYVKQLDIGRGMRLEVKILVYVFYMVFVDCVLFFIWFVYLGVFQGFWGLWGFLEFVRGKFFVICRSSYKYF